jgi:hypothetical protein
MKSLEDLETLIKILDDGIPSDASAMAIDVPVDTLKQLYDAFKAYRVPEMPLIEQGLTSPSIDALKVA